MMLLVTNNHYSILKGQSTQAFLTCQGHLPNEASLPPTILVWGRWCIAGVPQSLTEPTILLKQKELLCFYLPLLPDVGVTKAVVFESSVAVVFARASTIEFLMVDDGALNSLVMIIERGVLGY